MSSFVRESRYGCIFHSSLCSWLGLDGDDTSEKTSKNECITVVSMHELQNK